MFLSSSISESSILRISAGISRTEDWVLSFSLDPVYIQYLIFLIHISLQPDVTNIVYRFNIFIISFKRNFKWLLIQRGHVPDLQRYLCEFVEYRDMCVNVSKSACMISWKFRCSLRTVCTVWTQRTHKGFKATVVNLVMQSIHEGSIEITHKYSLF